MTKFDIYIRYKYQKSYPFKPEIFSTEVRIGNTKTVFPKKSFNDVGVAIGWPSGLIAQGKNMYSLYYTNCGDGSKGFSLDYIITDGLLVERHLTPHACSELEDEALIFDKKGKIIYSGPCDRQGKPLRKIWPKKKV